MIRYYFEPRGDTVLVVVKDLEKGLTYSRTPLLEWYKHISISKLPCSKRRAGGTKRSRTDAFGSFILPKGRFDYGTGNF